MKYLNTSKACDRCGRECTRMWDGVSAFVCKQCAEMVQVRHTDSAGDDEDSGAPVGCVVLAVAFIALCFAVAWWCTP